MVFPRSVHYRIFQLLLFLQRRKRPQMRRSYAIRLQNPSNYSRRGFCCFVVRADFHPSKTVNVSLPLVGTYVFFWKSTLATYNSAPWNQKKFWIKNKKLFRRRTLQTGFAFLLSHIYHIYSSLGRGTDFVSAYWADFVSAVSTISRGSTYNNVDLWPGCALYGNLTNGQLRCTCDGDYCNVDGPHSVEQIDWLGWRGITPMPPLPPPVLVPCTPVTGSIPASMTGGVSPSRRALAALATVPLMVGVASYYLPWGLGTTLMFS